MGQNLFNAAFSMGHYFKYVCVAQHESTMSNFWGRPGAGAPNSETNKLGNINDSIYTPRGQVRERLSPYAAA